jgi:succinate dehydrogenase/fumarate reductase-like Fe-S protein
MADSEGYFQDIAIKSAVPLSIKALLDEVHDCDSTFAWRVSNCFKGKCGSCLVRVNGNDVIGCVTMISPGETVRIEPHSKFKVIRDVVVDFSRPIHIENSGECQV